MAWSLQYDADTVWSNVVPAAQVEGIVVNDGQSQRSAVTTVEVTFTHVVNIDFTNGDVFELTRLDNGLIAATAEPAVSEVDGKTVVKLTLLPGDTVNAGLSLTDGRYQLRIDPTKVTIGGVPLDGDEDGTAGDEHLFGDHPNDNFFRRYGDVNGDDNVGLADFAAFRSVFGTSDGQESYRAELDADFDGSIGLADFAAFRSNFGS